jgi:hypothetical protein
MVFPWVMVNVETKHYYHYTTIMNISLTNLDYQLARRKLQPQMPKEGKP